MSDFIPPNDTRPPAFSYIRFSTPEQASGDSLRRQTKLAVHYAEQHGLNLIDASFTDLGVSAYRGANAETGRLGEFIQAVRSGAIPPGSWLLIESMDRLSRAKPRKAVRLLEDICDEGITVVTLADGRVYNREVLDDDPMAFMWAFMVAMRANEESHTKSLRVKKAWETKRRNARETGSIQTTRVPTWLKVRGGKQRRFELVKDKSEVVRRIFRMTLDGHGQHAIAQSLTREAVPTFGRGKYWHRTYVRKLLSSEAVIGIYTNGLLM